MLDCLFEITQSEIKLNLAWLSNANPDSDNFRETHKTRTSFK
ncbi:unnamed protein product [Acidithrix sp. C25]|nr:unnamed protein product [Acidithrix sp. C25]